MRRCLLILIFSIFYCPSIKGQCDVPQNTFANNIYFFSAQLNWSPVNGVNTYKIRYKELGTTPWSYKNNIDSLLTSKTLNNLTSQVNYIWQIRAHCDTNGNNSNWSQLDTFYTSTTFVPYS